MPLATGQKIIVTSADGTRRRRLPYAQITTGQARVERYGGMGQFTVNTAIPYAEDALSTILKGDRVEMWYQGVRRYRGWIEERLRVEGEPDTLGFVGYGLSFLVGQQLCIGRYAYAGLGADIGAAFGEIVGDASLSRNQTNPAPVGRQGLPLYDALQPLLIGTTTTFVDAKDKLLQDVANDLVQKQAGNLAIWGGDVDAFGQNRLYCRPLAPTTFPPTHTILVPSANTHAAQAEDQSGDLKNRALITGGQPRFPQMLHNGGFDLPATFQTGDSGLITDGDFEQKSWTLSGGAAYKDGGHQEGQPFSGNWMVELDHVGEAADKSGTFATAPTAGHSYVFSVRAKKEVGLQTADGSGWLHLNDASNNLLLSVPLTLAPAGTAWDYFSATFPMPANAAHWSTHFQCDHVASYNGDSGGLLIDAVSLEDASVVYQDGWQAISYGAPAQFNAINWIYKDRAFDGLYCVYMNVTAQDLDNHDLHLEPLNRAPVSVQFKQSVRLSLRYASPMAATQGLPLFRLELFWVRSDGSFVRKDNVVVAAQAASPAWQYAEVVAGAPPGATAVIPALILRGNGEMLVDCFSLQDSEAALAGDVPMAADGHPGYLPEGSVEAFVLAGGLGGAYAASEFTYGTRVDITSVGSLNTLAGLTQVGAARLRVKAVPLTRPAVTRKEDPAVYWPGDSLSLQGKHGDLLSGGQILTIAAVDLQFGEQFMVSLEIGQEAPDETLAERALIQDELSRQGPGGSSGGGAAGGYSNPTNQGGAGSGGGGVTATDGTTTISSATTLKFVGGTVAADATTGTVDITCGAGLPHGTADGQTLRWNAAASAYVADPLAVNNGAGTLTLTAPGGSNTGLTVVNQGTSGSDFPALVLGSHDAYSTIYVTNHGHPLGCITGYYTVASDGYRFLGADGTAIFSGWQNGNCTVKGLFQAGGYAASDGTAGVTGTGGGGDTIKNGLVTALGTPSASVTLSQAVPSAETAGTAGSVGTATTAARADHVHAMPAAYPPTAHAGSHGAGGSDPVSPASIGAESTANKGAANGYAGLDASGKIPTNALPASVVGGMVYQGAWDANANSPALASGTGTKGAYYKISVAGSTTLDGNSGWHVGDWVAFDGATWDKIDNFEAVTSVAGRVGAVTLATADIAGLGTAAVANVPAAGSNASSAQVVRGDDTRLGATTPLATTMPAAETAGAAGTVGTSTSAARADHVHAMPGPFVASGTGHAAGFVPDPGAAAGSTRFLREDGGWQVPPAGGSGSGGITLVTQLPVASASTRDVLYLLDGAGRVPDSLYVGVETAGSAYRLAKVPFSLLTNGGFQPTSIAGCTLWLPADALTSYSGTVPVLKWLDLSGNGYDATAPSNQAGTYVATAQNGLSVIAFSGSQFYSSNAPSAMLPFTLFAVVKPSVVPASGGADLAIFGSQAIGGMELRIDSNGMEALAEGRASLGTEGTGAIAAGAWVLLAMTYDGSGNYAFYRGNVSNGTTPTKTGTNTAAISASTVAVGQNINNGGEGFQGQMGELIQYSSALSSSNFAQVVSYLKSKWAV